MRAHEGIAGEGTLQNGNLSSSSNFALITRISLDLGQSILLQESFDRENRERLALSDASSWQRRLYQYMSWHRSSSTPYSANSHSTESTAAHTPLVWVCGCAVVRIYGRVGEGPREGGWPGLAYAGIHRGRSRRCGRRPTLSTRDVLHDQHPNVSTARQATNIPNRVKRSEQAVPTDGR